MGSSFPRKLCASAYDWGQVLTFQGKSRLPFRSFTNYLTNALKYSQAHCHVEIFLNVEGEMARVSVHDHGQGLPPSELEHVWERFYRSPAVQVQSGFGVGLGIGLHISRTIIERHHGQVGVESTPGEGSTFWFTLPVLHPLSL